MANSNQFIIVGLSGGVDSAVAAMILKDQGYHVEAVFMQNWEEDTTNNEAQCSTAIDLADAQKVCTVLNIKLHTVNFAAEYWQRVFQHFLDEYAALRTPNPDVLCNKEIKFKAFLNYAKSLGADAIATGHYARIGEKNNKKQLLKAVDSSKDQSYFLYLLNQEQLSSSIFPLGNLTKKEVRLMAQQAGLPNHEKKDSTGICFIGERKFKNFLSEYLLAKPGKIISTNNKVIGNHTGLMFYTIGQRQGLNIGGQKNALESPWYVCGKNIENNELIVTQDRNESSLSKNQLYYDQIHWISESKTNLPLECTAKIRYRQPDQTCIIHENNLVTFTDPQWAITPGQSIVFYQEDVCLGGGIIIT